VYSGDRSSKRWACCGSKNGVRSCEAPTKETFDAPQANQLQTIFTIGAPPPPPASHTTTSAAHAATAAGAARGASAAASPSSDAPTGLPPSAYGGIGAGAALIAILLAVGAVFLCRRKRKKDDLRQQQATAAAFGGAYIPRSSPGSEAGLRDYEEKETLHSMAPGSSHETSPVELSSVAGSQRRGQPGVYRVNTAEAVQFSRLRHELPADNEVVRPATAGAVGAGTEIPASLRAPTRPVTQGV
jgi:hypothetical protein